MFVVVVVVVVAKQSAALLFEVYIYGYMLYTLYTLYILYTLYSVSIQLQSAQCRPVNELGNGLSLVLVLHFSHSFYAQGASNGDALMFCEDLVEFSFFGI